MITIRDAKLELERTIGTSIRTHLPQTIGYDVKVDIIEMDRKKRSDAPRDSWQPAMGEIRLRFVAPAPVPATPPVTAIHLNRGHSEVIDSLEDTDSGLDTFSPVEIRGQALSQTVIQERR